MLEYRTGKPGEEADMIDLLNLVFSHDHCPHDFPTMLPKLYTPQLLRPECHYVAVRDGKLKACLGSYPSTHHICGYTLHSRDIGGVSVHPYARREGHMRKLMAMILEDMEKEGTDLSWLGGLRQRYGYWGYEHAGCDIEFEITRTNRRHIFGDRASAWTLKPLEKDSPALEAAKALHDRQSVWVERPYFYETLCSWTSLPYGFFEGDAFMGYCSLRGEDKTTVKELVLVNDTQVDEAVLALLDRYERLQIPVDTTRQVLLKGLYRICEHYRPGTVEQLLVLNFRNVVEAALALKGTLEPLPDCSFAFAIRESGEAVRVEIAGGTVKVENVERAEPVLERRDATAMLFAPISAWRIWDGVPMEAQRLLPLPLPLAEPDKV